MSSLNIKASFQGDIRRIRPTSATQPQLSEVQQLIIQAYNLTPVNSCSLRLKFKDSEGDYVTIASQEDLNEAIELNTSAKVSSLKLIVETDTVREQPAKAPVVAPAAPTPAPAAASTQTETMSTNEAVKTSPQEETKPAQSAPSQTKEEKSAEPSSNAGQANQPNASEADYISLIRQLVSDRELHSQLPTGLSAAIDSLRQGDDTSTVVQVFAASVPRLTVYSLIQAYIQKLSSGSQLTRCVDSFIAPIRSFLQNLPNVELITVIVTQTLLPQLLAYSRNVEPAKLYGMIKSKLISVTCQAHSGGSAANADPLTSLFKLHPLLGTLGGAGHQTHDSHHHQSTHSHCGSRNHSSGASSSSWSAGRASPTSHPFGGLGGIEALMPIIGMLGGSGAAASHSKGTGQQTSSSSSNGSSNPFEAFNFIRAATGVSCHTSSASKSASASSSACASEAAEGVHLNIVCDGCEKSNFTGNRWKCSRCFNIDFCSECHEKKLKIHPADHPMIKIQAPKPNSKEFEKAQKTSQSDSPAAEAAADQPTPEVIHHGVICDECNQTICGIRYKCLGLCNDFDLCSQCESKTQHDKSHSFAKLTKPIRLGLRGSMTNVECPYLTGKSECCSTDASPALKPKDNNPSAVFVSHANLPLGSVVPQGSTQVKQWNVQNDSSVPWPLHSRLIFVRGDELSTQEEFDVPECQPGQTVPVSAVLTIPDKKTGEYTAYFVLSDKDRNTFGQRLFTTLTVKDQDQQAESSKKSSQEQDFVMVENKNTDDEKSEESADKSEQNKSSSSSAESNTEQSSESRFGGVYSSQLAALQQLGFTNQRLNEHLLTSFGGRTDRVAEWLLLHSK